MKTQSNKPPKSSPNLHSRIRGDPATRRFGFFLFCALAMITIGVFVGIGVGNISHYEYFGPSNIANSSFAVFGNETIFQNSILGK